jgi:HNH endonuclease
MPFSEKTKLAVKRRAAFRCCRCHDVGVEVHHIVPEYFDGPNTLANAPLCPSCHDRFGDNRKKRKEIKQMRDHWYDVAREKYPTGTDTSALNDLVVELQHGELSKRDELIAELQRRVDELAESLSQGGTGDTTGAVSEITTGLVTAQKLGDKLYANVHCRNCGVRIGMLSGADHCPRCRTPIG